jgi:hypothetical protein
MEIEDRGKPVVILVNYGFLNDALSAGSSRGMPAIRAIAETVPCESTIKDDIENGINSSFDNLLVALTKPLSAEETNPRPKVPEKPTRIIFQGSLQEVNRFYYKRGWGDGFPIIPPTEEAVAEMLTGTDFPKDLELGRLICRLGKTTIEKLAINAVMAGALPTHFPVIIAATKLLLESEPGFCGFTTYGFSTGSWSPFWVINGPIRNEIKVNSGSGALSPGDIANAAIGRAMGLIIKNIGGIRKGYEDMGVLGNPMKYTMVIAENEEESPWEPLHVEYGCRKEDSAVTVAFPQSYIQHWPQQSNDEGILRSVMDNLLRGQRYTFIFTPPHAKTLARAGWTKKDIKQLIAEYARVPALRAGMPLMGGKPVGLFKGRLTPRENETVAIVRDPEFMRIIVAGGPGAFVGQVAGGGPTPGQKATQVIELPQNWSKLVAKYRDVVPTYIRY